MSKYDNLNVIVKDKIPVSHLMQSSIEAKSVIGEVGLGNFITEKNLHRPQLALAGYVGLFTFHRVQIFGNTEVNYLNSLTIKEKENSIRRITTFPIPCIILTDGNELDESILKIFESAKISVLSTKLATTKAFTLLSEFLDDQFSLQATVHGSFVDVYGVGILFTGRSGIGKSEVALDLIERGHRLVADDIIMITKTREALIMGTGTNLVQHFMEIRGLGLIDIRQMFGVRSIRFQKRLEIIVELEDWNENEEYTRTGLDEIPTGIMGVDIMTIKLPIFPGKNITVIAEVIALDYLLKTYGYNASDVFANKLREAIDLKTKNSSNIVENRIISSFQGDRE
jgi:HPr kinase/phosphorylase